MAETAVFGVVISTGPNVARLMPPAAAIVPGWVTPSVVVCSGRRKEYSMGASAWIAGSYQSDFTSGGSSRDW
jgi:hypothetical protein